MGSNRTWLVAATATLMLGTAAPALAGDAAPAAAPAMAEHANHADQGTPPTATPISFGHAVEGEISAASENCTADPRIKLYSFDVPANTRVEIAMRADDFDTYVDLGRMDGCAFTELASNDDGGGPDDGLNSRLVANLREAGTYVVRAKALSDDGAGKFSLTVNRLAPPAAAPAPIALTIGREVRGSLTNNDAMITTDDASTIVDSGRPYRLYTLTGAAGDEFEIRLMSDEFDSFLEIGAQTPLGYSVAASNDDGGEEGDNLNSRLKVTFQSAGTMTVRVSPLSADTGSYRLVATRVDPNAPPAPAHAQAHPGE